MVVWVTGVYDTNSKNEDPLVWTVGQQLLLIGALLIGH